jgi:hypothetical protein
MVPRPSFAVGAVGIHDLLNLFLAVTRFLKLERNGVLRLIRLVSHNPLLSATVRRA